MKKLETSSFSKLMSFLYIAMGIFVGIYAFFAHAETREHRLDTNQSWVNSIAQSSGLENGSILYQDSDGFLYIGGYFSGGLSFGDDILTSTGKYDIFVTKLDSDGSPIWATQAGGLESDYLYSLVSDNSGNIYIAGYFTYTGYFGSEELVSSGMQDAFIAKLDADGNRIWAKQAGGASIDNGYSVTIDSTGDIYLGGNFASTGYFGSEELISTGGSDIFVAKLDADGNRLQATQGGGTSNDYLSVLTIDMTGNVYVGGYFTSTGYFGSEELVSVGNRDIFIGKINTDGERERVTQAGEIGSDYIKSMKTNTIGTTYVAGNFSNTRYFDSEELVSTGGSDIFVAKLDADGNRIWAKQAGGADADVSSSLSVDNLGNIYIAGYFTYTGYFGSEELVSSGDNDIFVAKLDADGNRIWAKQAGGADADYAYMQIISNSTGDIFSFGRVLSSSFTLLDTSLTEEDIFITQQVFDITIPIFTGLTCNQTLVTSGGIYSTTGITITFTDDIEISGATINNNPYVEGTIISGDNIYVFIVEDEAENNTGMTFTIDTIAPTFTGTTLSGTSVVSGGYYNTGITIMFADLYLSGATLDGDEYISGDLITGEATHVFVVSDTLGNSTGMTFVIDTTAPTLTGASSGAYYSGNVVITGSDTIAFSGFVLSGTTYTGSSLTVTGEGIRVLVGYDRAGNSTGITFTIDKTTPAFTGTTLSGTSVVSGGYYNTGITITFADTNLSGATLNGSGYASGDLITTAGTYIFVVSNTLGNSTGMTFVIDTTAPTLTGTTLSGDTTELIPSLVFLLWILGGASEGELDEWDWTYNTGLILTYYDENFSGARIIDISNGEFTGEVLTSGEYIDDAGVYLVILEDLAGNESSFAFVVDYLNPIVNLEYPTSGLIIDDNNDITFAFTGSDDTMIVKYTLYITGSQIYSGDVEDIDDAEEFMISTVPLINGDYTWYVIATDLAGNTGVSTTQTFTLDTPLSATVTITGTNIVYNGSNPYTSGYVSLYLVANQPCDYIVTDDVYEEISGSIITGRAIANATLTGINTSKTISVIFTNTSGDIVTGSVVVYFDNTAPTPTQTSPTSGATITGAFNLVRPSVGADNVELSGYQYFVTTTGTVGTGILKSGSVSTATLSAAITTELFGSTGTYYRYVKAFDKLGNIATSAVRPFYYSGVVDTTPNAFSFNAVTSARLDRVYGSNTVTITGFTANTSVLASVNRGVLYISGNAVGTTGYVQNGWTVKIELISSDEYETQVNSTLTIGGVTSTFRVTTMDEADDTSDDTDYEDIETDLSSTERLQIIAIFETLRDLYNGDKEEEFFSSLLVMLQSKLNDLDEDDDDYDALQYLYDLAEQYYDDGLSTGSGSVSASRIVNGVYTAPNGKKYTITYDSVRKQFTSSNFITPKYYPTLDVLKYDIDRNNPAGTAYANAKAIKARWGKISIDGTWQTSAYTAPNRKVFYFFKTTGGRYSSYTFTTEKYFDSLELVKEHIYNNNR